MNKNHCYSLPALAALALLVVVLAGQTLCAQTFTVLYNFGAKTGDPWQPWGGLVQGADGALYGTAFMGGANSAGSVFKVVAHANVRVLYNFCAQSNCTDGAGPYGLTLRADGHFLGVTTSGGASGFGTIFDITQTGSLTQLYSFTGGTDGAYPWMPPTQGPDGEFYGITTSRGNSSNCGTAYSLIPTPAGAVFTLLHEFAPADEGCLPTSLALGPDGNFYGTTSTGGSLGSGTVFKMTRKGAVTVLHPFEGGTDGSSGQSLILGSDGNFYGTTQTGSNGYGTIFKIAPDGTFTVLHTMASDQSEGSDPLGLIQGSDGNFYGVADRGGTGTNPNCTVTYCGTLYEITPAGAFTVLHDFDFTDGSQSYTPAQHTSGLIYGEAQMGGIYRGSCGTIHCGVLYSLNNSLPPFVALVPYEQRVGIPVEILGQGFTSSTTVNFNGTPAAAVKVSSPTRLLATVPSGATTGYVTVTTSSGTLTSKEPFIVAP